MKHLQFKIQNIGILLLALFLWGVFAISSLQAQDSSGQTAESLTLNLLAKNKSYVSEVSATKKQEILNQMSLLAKARKQKLLELIETNPKNALDIMLPLNLKNSLPAVIQQFIEEKATVEGELEVKVVDDFKNETSRYLNKLKTQDNKIYSLYFVGDQPQVLSGSRIRVKGEKIDSAFLAASSGNNNTNTEVITQSIISNSFGAQKTLVILVNFQDNPTNIPFTVQQTQDAVFTTASNFFLENSYGQAWLSGDVAGWYTIAASSTNCNPNQIQSLGDSAATAAGFTLSDYGKLLYIFPATYTGSCGWGGLSSVGGTPSHSWSNGSLAIGIIGHELGHAFGLWHSHSLSCDGVSVCVPVSGSNVSEYGDVADTMGSPLSDDNQSHFNSYQKERLGWLNYNVSPPIATITANGTYTIYPYELNNSQSKAIKILKGTDPANGAKQWFYAEYRQPIGLDSILLYWQKIWGGDLTNGPLIHMETENYGDSSYLLDMTPQSSVPWQDFFDSPLAVGKTFTDAGSGISITTLSKSTSDTTVSVNFGTPTCVHSNPSIYIWPTSQWGDPGQTLYYYVTIANNDSSACKSSGFSITPTLPANFTQSPVSLSITLAPGAKTNQTVAITPARTVTGGSYTFLETATNSTLPTYTKQASAVYNVNNVVLDTTPPTTSITSPVDGVTISRRSTVTISASAADNVGVTRVEFYVNNKLISTSYASAYSCSWKVPAKPTTYQLQTKAYDAAGNVGQSAIITVSSK